MRSRILALVVLALAAPACKSKKPISVDTTDASDIPREIALSELKKTLPTVTSVFCALPKDTLKPSEIKEWGITGDGVSLKTGADAPFAFLYKDITNLQMARYGSSFMVRVFTIALKDANKEHFQFIWKSQEDAQRALELLEALRKKE